MGVDTTTANDHVSTNALDKFDDILSVPPAYYSFSQSPAAMEDPISVEETAVLMIRVKCVGQHGPVMRAGGEMRYKRDLAVQAVWKPGEPEPPDPETDQPGLFDGASDEDGGGE